MESMDRQLPDDPLAFIQACVRKRQIFWTYHVNMRLQGRHITREAILDAVDPYELVESYPQDKYLPSYLVLAHEDSNVFHVLFATDVVEEHVRIVTAYRPSADEWESDGKTRRTRQ
jgi:Domain of unknown function (DUF4258)